MARKKKDVYVFDHLAGVPLVAYKSQTSTSANSNPFRQDALEYMDEHKIPELFEQVTAALVYHRPDNPKEFLIEHLSQLEKARDNPGECEPPSLFDEQNLLSVFKMLDVPGKGYISLTQYNEAMSCLGVTKFTFSPAGAELNKISQETFVREAIAGLKLSIQTFSTE